MAEDKDKKKDREHAKGADKTDRAGKSGKTGARGSAGAADAAGGRHHAATAHGRPTRVDTGLPATRPELMTLHAAARARRNAAPLGSEAFRSAVDEIARIEVRIAAVDRAADPPLG